MNKVSIINKILILSLVSIFSVCFAIGLLNVKAEENTNYDIVKVDDEILGVNLKNSLTGALNFDVTGYDANTGYGVLSIELGSVDTSLSSGLLIKYSTNTNENMYVRMFIQTSSSVVYRLYAGTNVPKRNEVLIRSDGSVDYINNSAANSMHELKKEGTLFIPWEYAYKIGENATQMPAGTVITRLSITRDVRNSNQVGKTLTVGTIGTLKIDENKAEVVELLDAAKLNYTNDSSNKQADVNLANYANGKKVFLSKYMKGTQIWGSDSTVLAKVLSLVKLTRNPPKLTVKCVDEDGQLIKESNSKLVFNETGSEYKISVESFDGYLYQSSDKDLTGTISTDTVITLVYKVVPVPVLTIKYVDENNEIIKESELAKVIFNSQTGVVSYSITPTNLFGFEYLSSNKELTGEFTTDTEIELKYRRIFTNFEAVYDDNEFLGVNLKNSMGGALLFNLSDVNQNTGYGLFSIELNNLNIISSTGLLLRYKVYGKSSVFTRILLESEDGDLYRLYDDGSIDTRNDTVVKPNGKTFTIKTTGSHMLSGDGTLYIPWSHLYKVGGSVRPSSNTRFVKLYVSRDLRSETQKDISIAFGTIALCNVGKTVAIEELVDLTKLSYTDDLANTTADVNLADMTKGKIVKSNCILLGIQQKCDDDSIYEVAKSLYCFDRCPLQITINYIDEDGTAIKDNKVISIDYNAQGSAYNIIPDNIAKFEFKNSDISLSGTTVNNLSITLTYEKNNVPNLLVKFIDEDGNQVANSEYVYVEYSETDSKYHYTIEPKNLFGYSLITTEEDLSGSITKDEEIEIIYGYKFKNYDVVRDYEENFVGVNIKNDITGALVSSLKAIDRIINRIER